MQLLLHLQLSLINTDALKNIICTYFRHYTKYVFKRSQVL